MLLCFSALLHSYILAPKVNVKHAEILLVLLGVWDGEYANQAKQKYVQWLL